MSDYIRRKNMELNAEVADFDLKLKKYKSKAKEVEIDLKKSLQFLLVADIATGGKADDM